MVIEMNKIELQNKADSIYRETMQDVMQEMKLQLDGYTTKINKQGYDTTENLETSLTAISNNTLAQFKAEYSKRLNVKMKKEEIADIDKRISQYHKEVEKILNRFVATVTFLTKPLRFHDSP